MPTLKDIKAKASELEKDAGCLLRQVHAVNGQWSDQFLLAMYLVYRVRKGSIVEHKGKRYLVEGVDHFCQKDCRSWGKSQPWLFGRLIKKDGTVCLRTISLSGFWKVIRE